MSGNPFEGKTPAELRVIMAAQLNAILSNHIDDRAIEFGRLTRRTLLPRDILVDSRLGDRAGALLNATLVYGHHYED
jgi:hypothetical protein